jgi:hypothetical protein
MGCVYTIGTNAQVSEREEGHLHGNTATGSPATKEGVPQEWSVQIVKRQGEVLGAGLGNLENGVVIFSIKENGLLDVWNRTQLSNTLRPGLFITEVNGVVGFWDILEELQRPGVLHMKISAEPPSNAPNWFQEVAEMGRSFEEKWSSEEEGSRSNLLRFQPQDEFSSLPTVRAADCGVDQCAICMDDVGPDESLVLLPCKHAYHWFCVARWLTQGASQSSSKKHSCPLCCRRMVNSREGIVAVGADEPSASWPLSRPPRPHPRRSVR